MIDAKEYARALFLLTEELGTTAAAFADAALVKAALCENPSYEKLLDTPALPTGVKTRLIDEAFAVIDPSVKNLVKLLCERHAVHDTVKVMAAYADICDEARGILRVEAITAVSMTAKQTEALGAKLKRMTGKQVIVSNTVDKTILGGVKLRYEGLQIDGSLKSRLETLEKGLREIVI
ncbi:MAG: ATP synthase F1 subunit delta [Clostridia bacterium]|nr:ATP synthase F1 subunit delta [Clostridia bacterium]